MKMRMGRKTTTGKFEVEENFKTRLIERKAMFE